MNISSDPVRLLVRFIGATMGFAFHRGNGGSGGRESVAGGARK